MNNTFEADLKIGLWAEEKLVERLRQLYSDVQHSEGYNPYWDIWVIDTDKRIEVKYDEMSNFTPNFCVETSCNGHNSGIDITTSEVWAQFDGKQYTFIPTSLLKDLADDNVSNRKKIQGKDMTFKLINKQMVKEFGVTLNIDNCSSDELRAALNQYGSS